MTADSQTKYEAWQKVQSLVRQAAAILEQVNESPSMQAALLTVADQAETQANLWV
jgi:hypothetical protein